MAYRSPGLNGGSLPGGHALLGPAQQHGDRHAGAGQRGQIDRALLAQDRLGPRGGLVRHRMPRGEFQVEIIHGVLVGLHALRPLVRIEVRRDLLGEPGLEGRRLMGEPRHLRAPQPHLKQDGELVQSRRHRGVPAQIVEPVVHPLRHLAAADHRIVGPASPTLEIFRIVSPSGHWAGVRCSRVRCGKRGAPATRVPCPASQLRSPRGLPRPWCRRSRTCPTPIPRCGRASTCLGGVVSRGREPGSSGFAGVESRRRSARLRAHRLGHARRIIDPASTGLATPVGLEPTTCRLEGGCSIQLSYGVGCRSRVVAAAPPPVIRAHAGRQAHPSGTGVNPRPGEPRPSGRRAGPRKAGDGPSDVR